MDISQGLEGISPGYSFLFIQCPPFFLNRSGYFGFNGSCIRIFRQHKIRERVESIGFKLTVDRIERLRLAALLHDMGKIYIPSKILRKSDLSKDEILVRKMHSYCTYNILTKSKTLGGIADIYGQQQGQLRGLAGERAQFQSDALLDLAGAQQQYGAGRADIYGQAGATRLGIMGGADQQIAGLQERRGTGLTDIYGQTGQTRIGIRSSMDQVLASTRTGLANQYAQNYQSTTGALGGAIDRGGQLITQALGNIADKRETAFNINFYEPYVRQREFFINEMRRTDPFDMYTNYIGQMTGQTFNQQNQGVAGQMAGADMFAGAISQGMGNYFTGQYLDLWNQPQNQQWLW